ncbi:MAG: hypothetical protein J6A92_03820 [Lachnospiraceae bacterium]|nr:hypothetical protein [Lachnospiraceae bacterium]
MKQWLAKAIVMVSIVLFTGCGFLEEYTKSEVVLDGEYKLENVDNMTFSFKEKSRLIVRQTGIYEFAENAEGKLVVRICLDDISRELPEDYSFTEYLVQKNGLYTELVYTSAEFDLDTSPMVFVPVKGKDGLLTGDYFTGTYQIGTESDSYQYKFQKDGTLTMQINQQYYADEEKVTLSDSAGSTEYLYEKTEESLVLKNKKEEPILVLLLQE